MIDIDEIVAPENRGRLAISAMRIYLGVMFVLASWGKITAEGGFGQRMMGFLNNQKNMPDWYRGIVDSVVAPNADLFGFLTGYGELFLGLALIFGLAVRPALLFGLFMVVNFMFAKGISPFRPTNHDTLYIVMMIVLYYTNSGKFLGLDTWAKKRFPRLPL